MIRVHHPNPVKISWKFAVNIKIVEMLLPVYINGCTMDTTKRYNSNLCSRFCRANRDHGPSTKSVTLKFKLEVQDVIT